MTDKQFLPGGSEYKHLSEWNKTFREYPLHKCLHEFIEEQVSKSPHNPAVRFGGGQLSYSEFNSRANRCARYLRSLGIGPDSIVGVIMERSLELPIALAAILKAGGAYLPLDPDYPEERLKFMLEDAGVSVILTQEKFSSLVGEFDGTKFCMDSQWGYLLEEQESDLENLASPESLAYIIYTSGSTGKPKGCMLQHRAICNRLLWMQEKYCLTDSDRVLQKTPFTFDVSVWEFFWPLISGACLVLAKPGGHKDSNYLVETVRNEGITTCHFVPSMLRFFTSSPDVGTCNTLRQVFTSGEALTYDLMKEFKGKLGAELHNLYGPTEAAVDVTYWRCEEREDKKVPIGRPIFNIQLYILDANLNQVPIGQEGELHIGGTGLSKGYLNRPGLTAEKFIDNPFSTEPGAKLYKTGDKSRFLPDGNIEFLGRMDFQVKLRGNRIELGEIEETLRAYDGIEEAVVLVRDQESQDSKLVAYIVKDGEFPAPKKLREFVKSRLPDYMVPNIFVPIASMPVTQHGKLDRKALPWPIKESVAESKKTTGVKKEPDTRENVSKFLSDFMANAIGGEKLKEDSDLFDIGATSLTMAQLVEKIQNRYGIRVPVDVFLDDPTIKAVAHYVNGKLEEQGRATGSLDADVRADGKVETAVQQPNMEKADIHDNGEIKSDVISRLMGFLSGISGLERIKAEDDLFDIGATSLTMAQMVEIIQKNYNVTVPVEVILEEPSINTIAAYVAEKARISDIQRSDVKKEPVEGNIRPVKVPIESAGDTQKIIELNKAVFKESAYQKGRFGRNYVEKFIPFGLFSSFLSLLRRETIDREPKYLHPTAGGLNAVQTYIFIKENSIEGFERGVYYYHPEEHALYLIHDTPQIDGDIFFEYDRPVFHNAGFVLFFIAQLDAITPVYQGVSPSLVAIDAGYMGQLLLDRQSEFGMGVCPVVGVDFDRIASFFKLDKGHRFIHCMLGGTAGSPSLQDGDQNGKGLSEYIQKTGKNITGHLKNYTGDRTFAAFLDFDWKNTLKNMKYLNKEEHDNFHSQHLNIRKLSGSEKGVPLEKYGFKRSDYMLRSCRRDYLEKAVSFEQFGKFMMLLSREEREGKDYSLYPSVSGIYGVHVYVYIKENGVEGFDEGIYYYNPLRHELVLVTSPLTKKIKPSYTPFNRKQYQQSAFCLFLVSRPDDIKHLYNDDSLYLSLLESGYIGQLLMDKQAEFDIGVCPIGGLDFERIRPDFKLGEGYELLHSFTCGSFVQEIPEDRELVEAGRGSAVDVDSLKERPSLKKTKPAQYDLAIVGISGRYPGARNMEEFWEILKEGRSSISDIPEDRKKLFRVFGDEAGRGLVQKSRGGYLEDIDSFDSLLFNISPSEARITDPQERLFMEIAWECLENAGYTAENLIKTSGRIGVFVGAMWNDYQNQSSNLRGKAREVKTTAFHSSVANRVSYFFDFNGPSVAVNTSCSSAMTALHFACESIKRGECDAALVGGVNLLTHPYHEDLLLGLDMLSGDCECRPLGAQATGWLAGEGVGAVLIKPVKDAERDKDYIHGVIKGTSIGHSGRSVRFGAPNTVMQEDAIKRAIENSGVSAGTISYIELAAAGSSIADASEVNAVKKVFEGCIDKEAPLLIGSVKGSIGHLESASAMSQLAKVLLQMKHRRIVPSVNSNPVNPLIQLQGSGIEITDALKPWSSRDNRHDEVKTGKHIPLRAVINAFGATGSGGHIILEEYIHEENRQDALRSVIIPISAASEEQLNLQVSRLYEYLTGSSGGALNLSDIGYTLKAGRIEMDERLAIVAESTDDLIEKLVLASNGRTAHGVYRGTTISDIGLRLKEDKDDIHLIAEQWVKGAAVEWNLLKDGKRIPLPTYPFAKVKHWYGNSDLELAGKAWPTENGSSRPEDKEVISLYGTHEDSTLLNIAENYLKKIFSEVSEVPLSQINVKAALDKYGINSVMIAKLNSRLEKDFGELPKTLFFEYLTLHELAGYFLKAHYDKLVLLPDGPVPVAKSVTYRNIQETTDLEQNGLRPLTLRREQESKAGDIAIIGLSGRYPKARTTEEFWENLKNGLDCISEIPEDRWDYKKFFDAEKRTPGKIYSKWGGFIDDVDKFDPLFFNISPREAETMDPQERLFLETVWNTLEDSGYSQSSFKKAFRGNVGVFVGVMYGEYQLWNDLNKISSDRLSVVSTYGSIANRVSYIFDFHGPSMAVDTLCSSSLTAIHLAVESIKRGECEAAIAGGVNISIHPAKYVVHSQLSMASTDGRCRSFGEGGDGFVPGEGVGAVLLKPLHNAVRDGDHIYGVIKGTSVNHGGKTNGYTVPNPTAQSNLIRESLRKAGIDPRTISYVEAHGTGTSLGDPIEISALSRSFGENAGAGRFCSVGSVKSNIGHLEGAAGIAGLTKVLMQMKYKKLVPSLHSKMLNPNISFEKTPFYVQQELADWDQPVIETAGVKETYPRRATVSSFGAGGANAHIVIEEYSTDAGDTEDNRPQIIILSAKDDGQLKSYAAKLLNAVGKLQALSSSLKSTAYTLQVGRDAMDERLAVIAGSFEELEEKLKGFVEGKNNIHGLFYGQAKRNKDMLTIFAEDEDLQNTVDSWISKGKYEKIAELWAKGLNIDWEKLYVHKKPLRISLPTYPFAGKRYWINTDNLTSADPVTVKLQPEKDEAPKTRQKSTLKDEVNESFEIMTFEEIWEEKALLKASQDRIKTLVCFLSEEENRQTAKEEIQTIDPMRKVVFISQGTGFLKQSQTEYSISKSSEEHYKKAFGGILEDFGSLDGVFYLWPEEDSTCVKDYSVILYTLKAVSSLKLKSVRLLLAGQFKNNADDCYMESWIGFERSLGLALPGIRLAGVYRNGGEKVIGIGGLIRLLWDELNSENIESVLYKGGKRHVYRVRRTSLQAAENLIRENGTYLITGGLGNLGYLFAEHLAKTYHANIILTGRTLLNEEKRLKIKELEKKGGRIYYLQSDVSDLEAMREGLNRARELFGVIHGIIHSAGVINNSNIAENTIESFNKILATKIEGTIVLDQLFEDKPLDFICYFSSASAVLGDFGSCDYAVGNRFQKAFANYRNGRQGFGKGKVVAIQWPMWKDSGMSFGSEENVKMYLKSSGQRFLDKNKGLELFERLLGPNNTQPLVLAGQRSRVEKLLRLTQTQSESISRNLPGTAGPGFRPEMKGFTLEQCLEWDLKEQISKVLKIPREELDIEENLADFGFDSISLIEYAKHLTELYDIEITPALFFGYSTVQKLIGYYLTEHGEFINDFYKEGVVEKNTCSEVETSTEACAAATAEEDLPAVLEERIFENTDDKHEADEPIAIIGMSGRFPQARNTNDMWDILEKGIDAVEEIPPDRFDWRKYFGDPIKEPDKTNCKWCGCVPGVREFDPAFFDISPREAVSMDPRQRLLLQEAWKALEDAGYGEKHIKNSKIGMFVGAEQGDYQRLVEDTSITSNNNAVLAARLAYFLDLKGPVLAIDTACSSGLVAVHQACMSLRNHECDTAVAAGANLLLAPQTLIGMGQAGMLSGDGKCYTFDRRANGIVPGEAVAALVLKPLSKAVEDGDPVYAVIKGSGINFDGKTNGITAPNGIAQTELIKSVYDRYHVNPEDIEYIVTHGTGTKLGDPVEINALYNAFKPYTKKQGYCAITSNKTNFGHAMGSSGIISLINLIQALLHETIPANIHFEQENDYINWKESPFYVNKKNKPWPHSPGKIRTGAVSAFGMSGTNAHVVLQSRYEYSNDKEAETLPYYLLVLSAKTKEALKEKIEDMVGVLENGTFHEKDLPGISYTLLQGRHHFSHRCAVVIKDIRDALYALKKAADGEITANLYKGTADREFAGKKASEHLGQDIPNTIQGLEKDISKYKKALEAVADLYCQGYSVDWESLSGNTRLKRLHLPSYPFSKGLYWAPQITYSTGNKVIENLKQLPVRSEEKGSTEAGDEKPKDISLRTLSEKTAIQEKPAGNKEQSVHLRSIGLALEKPEIKDDSAPHESTKGSSRAEASKAAPVDSLCDELRISLARALYLKPEDVELDKQFIDMGMDSIIGVEWIREINKKYGTSLGAARVYDYPTLREFSMFMAKELEKKRIISKDKQGDEAKPQKISSAPQKPQEISLLDSVKASRTKRPEKHQIREQPAFTVSEGHVRELQEELRISFAEALFIKPEEVELDRQFNEMGMDSIIGVEWIRGINRKYGTSFGAARLYDYPTISEFSRFIAKELKKNGEGEKREAVPPDTYSNLREMLEKVQKGTLNVEQGEQILNSLKKRDQSYNGSFLADFNQ